MNAHTPTPWVVARSEVFKDCYDTFIQMPLTINGYIPLDGRVAQVYDKNGMKDQVVAANAEFIVKACNAHDELVANLEQLLNCSVWAANMLIDIPQGSHFRQSINEARKLIAKNKL